MFKIEVPKNKSLYLYIQSISKIFFELKYHK